VFVGFGLISSFKINLVVESLAACTSAGDCMEGCVAEVAWSV